MLHCVFACATHTVVLKQTLHLPFHPRFMELRASRVHGGHLPRRWVMCCQPDTRAVGLAPTRLLSYPLTLSLTSFSMLVAHLLLSPVSVERIALQDSGPHVYNDE